MRARWTPLGSLLVACSPPAPPAPAEAPATASAQAPSPPATASGPRRRPPPTEHSLDPGAEKANKEARKLWIRQKHRAAPGVDTTAIERENGLRQNERRRRLHAAPPSHTTSGWVERGSDNQAGRTHAARLSPSGDTLYVGSSLGGVWRGSPDGADWEPLGDNLYGGAHWVEVLAQGAGGDVVFVATDGGMVHRSEDDGQTWEEPSGLDSPTSIRRAPKTSARTASTRTARARTRSASGAAAAAWEGAGSLPAGGSL